MANRLESNFLVNVLDIRRGSVFVSELYEENDKTLVENRGHDVWNDAFQSEEVYRWLWAVR
jgi:hypothetical protein